MNTNIAEDALKYVKLPINASEKEIYKFKTVQILLQKYVSNLYGSYMVANADFKKEIEDKGKDHIIYKLTHIDGSKLDIEILKDSEKGEMIVRGVKDGAEVFHFYSNKEAGEEKVQSTFNANGIEETQVTTMDKAIPGVGSTLIKYTRDGVTSYRRYERMGVSTSNGEYELYSQYGINPTTNKPIKRGLSNVDIKKLLNFLFTKNKDEREELQNDILHDYDAPMVYAAYSSPSLSTQDRLDQLSRMYDRHEAKNDFLPFERLTAAEKDKLLADLNKAMIESHKEMEFCADNNVTFLFGEIYKNIENDIKYNKKEEQVKTA